MARSSPILFLAVALLAALLELLVGHVAGIRQSSSTNSDGEVTGPFDSNGQPCKYPDNYAAQNDTETWEMGGIPKKDRDKLEDNPRVLTYAFGPAFKGKKQIMVWSYDDKQRIVMWYAKPDRSELKQDNLAGKMTCKLCPSCVEGAFSCSAGAKTFSEGEPVDIGLSKSMTLRGRSVGEGVNRYTLFLEDQQCDLGPIYVLPGFSKPKPCFKCLTEADKDGDVEDDELPGRFHSAMSHFSEDAGQLDDSPVEQTSSKQGARKTTGCIGGCLTGFSKLISDRKRASRAASLAEGSATAPNDEGETGVAA